MANFYLFDNNIFITLAQYAKDRALWDWLAWKGSQGLFGIPDCILDEYKSDNSDMKKWIEKNLIIGHPTDLREECMAELMATLPDFSDATKPGQDADQPLVACAMALNKAKTGSYASGPVYIVTHETPKKPLKLRLKIPDACAHYQIKWVTTYDLLGKEGCFVTHIDKNTNEIE